MSDVATSTGKRGDGARHQAAADDWDDWSDDGTGPGDASEDDGQTSRERRNEGAVALAEGRLGAFLADLVDAAARAELEEYLCSIPFPRFMEYYLASPNLAEYTAQNELHRMDYTVSFGGTTTSDKSVILSIFEKTKLNDLWRLANQSIYADAIFAIQELYLSPDLTVTVHSSRSRFAVDLDRSVLSVCGTFDFSAPYTLDGDKRHFASICVHIVVDIVGRTVHHTVETPIVKVVFDADLHEVAKCAVELLGCDEGDRKFKWFSKIGSIVDARAQLLSDRIITTTGMLIEYSVHDLPVIWRVAGFISTVTGAGIMEGLVGSLGRFLGADKAEDSILPLPNRRGTEDGHGGETDRVIRLYRKGGGGL